MNAKASVTIQHNLQWVNASQLKALTKAEINYFIFYKCSYLAAADFRKVCIDVTRA